MLDKKIAFENYLWKKTATFEKLPLTSSITATLYKKITFEKKPKLNWEKKWEKKNGGEEEGGYQT